MTDVPTSAGPPPGWYAEAPQAVRLRWWNGSVWTDHYQAATDTSAIPAPVETPAPVVEPVPEPLPTTRAARRAAATAAVPTAADAPPVPVWAAMTAEPAEPAEVAVPAEAMEPAPRGVDAPAVWPPAAPVEPTGWVSTDTAGAAGEPTDAAPDAPAGPKVFAPEAFPDQIVGRSARSVGYRPPLPPVTYQPHSYVAVPRGNFIPVTSRNGPAAASLTLSFLGAVAGILVYALVTPANPSLAGLLNLLIIAAFLSALGLAVVALVLAAQRPTRKGRSVLALIISALLLIGTCTAFALRLIPVGALYSGG